MDEEAKITPINALLENPALSGQFWTRVDFKVPLPELGEGFRVRALI
jgi:hypothetical protein